ncbi:hypothetical protein [Bosea sp. UC22_33]|uniref:hypothetical protein n=1 Tax=Bosea sp. UC22_33 TaxID=3350165 RepID=UPI003672E8A4
MQVAPIRSPIDMLRAQSRLKLLGVCTPGTADEIESAALRDAIEHYRCVTQTPDISRRSPGIVRPPHG